VNVPNTLTTARLVAVPVFVGLFLRGDRKAALAVFIGAMATDALDGVLVENLDARYRRQFNIPDQVEGALVVDVDAASPAAAAGLRPGDVILELNRQRVHSADEAVQRSREIKGDRVLLRVWSGGGSRYLVVDAAKRRYSSR